MNFKEQAENFMNHIATRKRNPVRLATRANYRSLLNKWILPSIGNLSLADVHNGTVKPLIDILAKAEMSPSTIGSVLYVVEAVVKSAQDANGNELYPRTWNTEFLDVPVLNHADQKAPTPTPKTVQRALDGSTGQFKALVALLAGTGLRIGEALALRVGPDNGVDSYWVPDEGTLIIRSTIVKGEVQHTPKTVAGKRTVDLHPDLNLLLMQTFCQKNLGQMDELLFHDTDGGPLRSNSTALYSALEKAGIHGFHSLRRFRLTHLDKVGASRGFIKASAGHADSDITDRYINSNVDADARKAATQNYGLGFQLGAQ